MGRVAERLKGGLTALVIGLLVGWFIALRPALETRETVRERVDALEQRLETRREAVAARADQRQTLSAIRRPISAHPMRLPIRPDYSGLVSRITTLAADTGVRGVDISPGETHESPHYHRRIIRVRVKGRWSAITAFLTRMGAETRAITLTGLTLARPETEATHRSLKLTLRLHAHWQPVPEGGDPGRDAGIGWTLARASPPVAPGVTVPGHNPFQRRPQEPRGDRPPLAYVGRITYGAAEWALIRNTDGVLQRHRIGERIPGAGRLTRVAPKAVTIERESKDGPDSAWVLPRHSGRHARGE
jgi:Tfp pilus assembly protein PilO